MKNFVQPMAVLAVPLLTALLQRHLVVLAISSLHIQVVIDLFSKYLQLYAVLNGTAEVAAQCMQDYSLRFGIPLQILSDQDPASKPNSVLDEFAISPSVFE